MKKLPYILAFIALLLTAVPTMASPGDSTAVQKLTGRIDNLELMRDNLTKDLELKKRELAQEIIAHKSESDLQFWSTIIALVLGAGSILGSYWIGVAKAKKAILTQAEHSIQTEVEKQLPVMVDKQLEEKLKVLQNDLKFLRALLDEKQSEELLKTNTDMLVIGENPDELKAGKELLISLGFKKIKEFMPTKGETLPHADAYFVHRRFEKPDQKYQLTDDRSLVRYIDLDIDANAGPGGKTPFIFFVTTSDTSMYTKRDIHGRLGFVNESAYANDRIIQTLKKPQKKA